MSSFFRLPAALAATGVLFTTVLVATDELAGQAVVTARGTPAPAATPTPVTVARPDPSFPQLHVSASAYDGDILRNTLSQFKEGRQAFRYETFGNQAFWGDTLRLHEAIAGEAHGGVGPGVSPKAALEVGLKVDKEALPAAFLEGLQQGRIDLNDPAATLELLRYNAVVGLTGFFDDTNRRLRSLGIQCALCHSTVDNSVLPGIGSRRDGWANRDLNVGAILSLAPNLTPFTALLGMDETMVKAVFASWGPGKFDAQLILDGKAFAPNGTPGATLIPPAFGMAGVNLHTSTGAWGTVSYWNALVSNLEMMGRGTFYDPRLANPERYPIAAAAGFGNVRNSPDLITPRLAALHFYQLALPAPKPPEGSFDPGAAGRGQKVFNGAGRCATCHVPPLFTEPGWNLHTPEEIGIDAFQANRSPDGRYRTSPLRGLWSHQRGGFYHDGRFATLTAVIQHYDRTFTLGLTDQQRSDLVQYLLSL